MKARVHFPRQIPVPFSVRPFASQRERSEFRIYSEDQCFAARRFFMLVGAVAFLLHAVLDIMVAGEAALSLVTLRVAGVFMMLAVTAVFIKKQYKIPHENFVFAYLLIPCLTIIAMMWVSPPGIVADMYPLSLVVIIGYGIALLSPRHATLIGLCTVVYGLFVTTLMFFSEVSGAASAVNLFFLTFVLVAFCAGSANRERFHRARFRDESAMKDLNRALDKSRRDAVAARDAAIHASEIQQRFIASISHELRTPLNAVIGFSDVMVSEVHGPMQPAIYGDYAQDILSSGKALLLNLNDLLDVQRLTSGKMSWENSWFSINQMVRNAVALSELEADAANVGLLNIPRDPAIDAYGDVSRMTQAVSNLLTNALKFTDSGGHVMVTQTLTENSLVIAVADTGIGISEEDLQRVATPFQQGSDDADAKKKGGLGLGLSIVNGIMAQMDGELEMRSKVGEGTVCSLVIPRHRLTLAGQMASVA